MNIVDSATCIGVQAEDDRPLDDATRVARASQGLGMPVVLATVTYAILGEAMALVERHDHLFLEAYRLATPGIVELLVEELGAKRLLFGSGAPPVNRGVGATRLALCGEPG